MCPYQRSDGFSAHCIVALRVLQLCAERDESLLAMKAQREIVMMCMAKFTPGVERPDTLSV